MDFFASNDRSNTASLTSTNAAATDYAMKLARLRHEVSMTDESKAISVLDVGQSSPAMAECIRQAVIADGATEDRIPPLFAPTEALQEQIRAMVAAHEDWIPDADGVDASVHIVVNDFDYGVWLCEHHGECNMHKFTRVQRLA